MPESEREAKDANKVAGGNIDMDISIAAADRKAHGTVVSNVEPISIRPSTPRSLSPSTNYPTLSLLKYEDNDGTISTRQNR